ncbi:MAG TPA: hypothetical protein VFD86_06060, partial [Nitrospira sp.]|nr:hypothetical protein [Nitrospira sp.]
MALLRFEEPVGMAEEFPRQGLAQVLLQGLRFLLQGWGQLPAGLGRFRQGSIRNLKDWDTGRS